MNALLQDYLPLAVFLFARRLWGTGAGLVALVYLALAPAYFPFYDVNSYALFVTLGGVGCFAALVHAFDRLDPAPFAIDIGTTESLVLKAGGDENRRFVQCKGQACEGDGDTAHGYL